MKKIREIVWKNAIIKYYQYEKVVKPVEFMEALSTKGWKFDKVFMERDAEMDMQFDIGYYTLDELRQAETVFSYGDPCTFTLPATLDDHSAEIHFCDGSQIIYIYTSEIDFELE